METSLVTQVFDVIKKSNRVLILLPERPTIDTVASGLALRSFLLKLEKDADVVSAAKLSDRYNFLPGIDELKSDLDSAKSFVVVVDTAEKPLDELSYQAEDGKLHIYLKPKSGQYSPEDVSFNAEKKAYDAAVVLDCPSLENLGPVLEENSDTIFELPKINIDNHPDNSYFGAVNLVDINTTSIAEILALAFEQYEKQLVDEDIATNLLAGIIAKTHSFQRAHTTPRAFLKASELIALGGRQQEVIKNLFKTKPLALLRLWGRALARLKIHDSLPVIYSLLNLSDFGKAGARVEDLAAVLREMLDNISGYKVIGLLAESLGGNVRLLVALHPQVDAAVLLGELGQAVELLQPAGTPFSLFEVELKNKPILEAENILLGAVSKALPAAVTEE